MFDPEPPRPPRLVVEVLGTGAIPSNIFRILAGRFWEVHEDGMDLPPDKRSGQGIQPFLAQLASGVDHIPGLEQFSLIGVDQNGTVHLLYYLFYVLVELYST